MAKPIEPTPTLEGKDAELFYAELDRVKTKGEIAKLQKQFARADGVFKKYGKHFIRKMID